MAPVPGAPLVRAQQRFIELARERAKQHNDPLGRSGRFHILLRPPQVPVEELRRVKNVKKKKQLQ
jgi:hypothetical protein